MRRYVLIACGFLLLALGAVGIVIPVLPTTPFVLLAAGCFSASSPKSYRFLTRNRFFGPYIEHYKAGGGISKAAKARGIIVLWVLLTVSAVLADKLWLYLLLSAVALAFGWVNPLWGGPLAAFGSVGWEWMVVLVAVAVTVVLTMWPQQETPVTVEAPAAGPDDGEPLDYVRTRTPSVPVTLADGTEVSLRALSMTQPILLLAVNPGCAPCAEVMARLPEWRALLPQVSVRLLLTLKPEVSAHAEHAEPQSLHDPYHFVRDSIADWATPTAVLLGADGMLAGGPVTGYRAISVFVDDIYESLNGERPTR